jgi:hypothetical protein
MASIAKNKPTLTNITSASTAYCCVTAPFVCDRRMKKAITKPGSAATNSLRRSPPPLVGVSYVGLPRRARLEVVAVLRAAHTARAMTVGHGDERRLPVAALKQQQRADAAAPTAVALEHKAAHDGRDDYRHEHGAHRCAVAIQSGQPRPCDAEESGDCDQVAAFAQPVRHCTRAADAPRPRHLVARRHRTNVASQPRCGEEQDRQPRLDHMEHHEQAGRQKQ